MHKADIARHIHQPAGISETESAQVLEWFLELLKTTLQAGESITIFRPSIRFKTEMNSAPAARQEAVTRPREKWRAAEAGARPEH